MSIELSRISYTYMKGTPYECLALQNISLSIAKGEFIAVIGHTGSGKSTLIQQMNGLLQPESGQACVDGVDLSRKGKEAKAARTAVGMVFQYPEQQLFAETVYEDIAFGPRNRGFSEQEVERQVREAMAFTGLDYAEFATRNPFRLSGGQMRRVAIAGVVAMAPDYLILDEPSAGLDPRSRDAIFQEIVALHASRGIAVVLVTHSMEEAARYADRLLVLAEGRLLFDGRPAVIFARQQEELLAAGMDVPQVLKLAALLRARGMPVPPGVTSEEALVKWLKKRRGCQ